MVPPLLIPSEPSVNLLAFLGKFRLVLGEIPLNLYRPGAWRVQEQVLGQGSQSDSGDSGESGGPRSCRTSQPERLAVPGQSTNAARSSPPAPGAWPADYLQFSPGIPGSMGETPPPCQCGPKLRGKMILQAVLDPVFPGTGQESQALSLPPAST